MEKNPENKNDNNAINWDEIIKSNKGVIASNDKKCGIVVAQTEDEIVISEGVVNRRQFIMPKSKVDYYDGNEVHLNIPSEFLSAFEIKEKNK